MSAALLSFHCISFGYQRKNPPVIDSLEYSLKEGSITAILGPNGAGKTTLVYLALGWLTPWSGQITLSGCPMERIGRRSLGRQVALVPQSEHIPFEYSVLDYVLLGRSPHLPTLGMPSAVDEQIAYGVLEKIGIADLHDQSVLSLSGGERQLVLVARALAQEPRLLLLDEPTAHLDLSNKYRLVQIIKGLQEHGTTILMTTHDPELALAVSSESILMEKGSILTAGPTSEVTSTENLSRIYRVPIRIVSVEGKSQVLWI
jgi:iron complex transport system ATP-binding protein